MTKFLHTADIHLDSPLTGLSKYAGAPVDMLRSATRQAFVSLIDTALEENVDFVVIAGDLYDGDWRDYNTGLFFSAQMGRLKNAGISAYVALGNHDAQSAITKQLRPPDNVHIFSTRRAQSVRLQREKVALHGQSFKLPATHENLAKAFPEALPGYFNIGVLHTALEGHSAHANYAPCSMTDLQVKGYDYWALGHVHEFSVRAESPHIVYPGNVQGRHVRETGPRGAVLVTLGEGNLNVERVVCDVLRWCVLDVNLSEANDPGDAYLRIAQALENLLETETTDAPLAVRVNLTGRSRVYGALYGLDAQLRAETLNIANACGAERIWIEKVCNRTSAYHDEKALAARSDAVADLQVLLAAAKHDDAFLNDLLRELKPLLARAPKALVDESISLDGLRRDDLGELVDEVAPALIARIENEI